MLCINLIPVLRACPPPSLVRAGGGGGQQRRALLVARVRVHVREELLRGGALEVAVRQAGVAVRLPPVERVVQGAPDVAGRRFGETAPLGTRLRTVKTKRDGDCFFSAICKALTLTLPL